jgi:L-aminopeptidase/D-esterase-like protein
MAAEPARDFGIHFNDFFNSAHCTKGTANSIVDVAGVCVGHANFMLGKYYVNNVDKTATLATAPPPSVNSGVKAILPLGIVTKDSCSGQTNANAQADDDGYGINTSVPAGFYAVNGNGEMTGIH